MLWQHYEMSCSLFIILQLIMLPVQLCSVARRRVTSWMWPSCERRRRCAVFACVLSKRLRKDVLCCNSQCEPSLLTAVTLPENTHTCSLLHTPAPALLRDEQAPSPIYHCAFGFAPVRCLRHTNK